MLKQFRTTETTLVDLKNAYAKTIKKMEIQVQLKRILGKGDKPNSAVVERALTLSCTDI